MKPIIIDAATIFDPARLIAVLASVDIRYSEVWVSQRYDHFKEKDFITGFGTESKFALLPDLNNNYKTKPLETTDINEKLNPKSWTTGPKILRWALSKGMIVPKDLYKYNKLAIQLERENNISNISEAIMLGPPHEFDISIGKESTKKHLKKTGENSLGPDYSWRLEPYGIGNGLGLMLAVAQEENVDPFFSHPHFTDRFTTHNYTYYEKETFLNGVNKKEKKMQDISLKESLKDAKRLVKSPESLTLSDVAFYLDQKERINSITGIITASEELESRNKDIGIIASKFVGSLITDIALFSGNPVTSTLVTVYDIYSRYLKHL